MTDNYRLHKEESNKLREENSGKYVIFLTALILSLYASNRYTSYENTHDCILAMLVAFMC